MVPIIRDTFLEVQYDKPYLQISYNGPDSMIDSQLNYYEMPSLKDFRTCQSFTENGTPSFIYIIRVLLNDLSTDVRLVIARNAYKQIRFANVNQESIDTRLKLLPELKQTLDLIGKCLEK